MSAPYHFTYCCCRYLYGAARCNSCRLDQHECTDPVALARRKPKIRPRPRLNFDLPLLDSLDDIEEN